MAVLRLGLPKGSLEESTYELFAKAGYAIRANRRSYYPEIDDSDITCTLIRPQEMARYIAEGVLDAGLTGHDWVVESGADVHEVAELIYGKVGRKPLRWVVAVPAQSDIRQPADLEGKKIATEAVGMAEKYLAAHGVSATVEFSWGATEVKPPTLADAIIEITETGSSLRANDLRIIDEVCTSTTRLVANHEAMADDTKRAKIDQLALLLKAALAAETRVGLMMNVRRGKLKQVLNMLPALRRPTMAPLVDEDWVALTTVIEEKVVRDLVPQLLEAGAEGIVEFPLNKIVG